MSTKKNVMIKIFTTRMALNQSLFEEASDGEEIEYDEEFPAEDDNGEGPETSEVWMEGRMVTGPERVELVYEESELSGMEGAKTTVYFRESEPGLITMMRSGPVNTALVFEEKSRHICAYQTPFMPFELCVHTLKVDNRLLGEGKLYLDYIIEFRGAKAEHNLFELTIFDAPDRPKNILF